MKSKVFQIIILGASAITITGCVSRGNNPGWEYAPDMYYSKGYEPYSQGDTNDINPHGMTMREPVAGTIAWGKLDYVYAYENNEAGYEAAGKELSMPKDFSDANCRGEYMYNIYCAVCHGKEGKNDGKVLDKLGKPPFANYQTDYIKNLPVGKIYHVLTYGKNNMGSHASVLNPADRWRVVNYVKLLSEGKKCVGSGAPAASANAGGATVKGEKLADAAEQQQLESFISAVNFRSGTANLTEDAIASLKKLAEILKKHPEVKLSIDGHTDNSGPEESNRKLSKARAEAVAAVLSAAGVNKANLATHGFGSTKPVADNKSEEGKAKNRRVEFILSH